MRAIYHTPETYPVNGQKVLLHHGEHGADVLGCTGEPAVYSYGDEFEKASFTVGAEVKIKISAEGRYWSPRGI